jgi:2-polyprenyl-6-methoxyphenol hydroxylase-like FAD-dependent oxidoreductase
MTFAFERTGAGWIWCYGYPSGPGISACVVECLDETWRGLGLDAADDASPHLLADIFRRALGGASLISSDRGRPARWGQYRETTNARWWHENTVLVGDAAHTVHFTMGSGTGLAMMERPSSPASLYHARRSPRR